MVFKTKEEITFDLVKYALKIGINFRHVGADAGYGKKLKFIKKAKE